MLFLGIDLGTRGARAIIVDEQGAVQVEASRDLPPEAPSAQGVFEQDPLTWRKAIIAVVGEAVAAVEPMGVAADEISALSATSTSGTLCLVDARGATVGSAMMYSDLRAAREAEEVQAAGSALAHKLGTRFNASFALCRMLWLHRHAPHQLRAARWCLSPTDLIIGWLSGSFGHTDWSNALKWGYDVVDLRWPSFIEADLGLPLSKLPCVVAPGTIVARVSAEAAEATGLSQRTLIVAGATDGVASQLASGAVAPGDWNSTLGTTLVLKGVSVGLLRDPKGRIYSHRHPDGYWLPGGASNTGADCLAQRFPAARLSQLNAEALSQSPTDLIVYPLVRRGERFPFDNPQATGFVVGETSEQALLYAAYLEGLAYTERLCYEVVQELGGEPGDEIFAMGGATHSEAGLQIRADVLGRRLRVPAVPQAAMGAAVLAARAMAYRSLSEAGRLMVNYRKTVEPREQWRHDYAERYGRFVDECRARGYLT